MSEELNIEVARREETGKNANRRLRASGRVPAVVYGLGRPNVPVSVDTRQLTSLMRQAGTANAVFNLKLAGTDKRRHVMVRDLQMDPIRNEYVHLDFLRVDMSEVIRVMVEIELDGVPIGVKDEGGVLDHVVREVEVECTPDKIPNLLHVDVSGLGIGDSVHMDAVAVPDGVELLDDPALTVASVVPPDRIVEPEEEEEELLEAEQAEPVRIGGREEEEDEETAEAEG